MSTSLLEAKTYFKSKIPMYLKFDISHLSLCFIYLLSDGFLLLAFYFLFSISFFVSFLFWHWTEETQAPWHFSTSLPFSSPHRLIASSQCRGLTKWPNFRKCSTEKPNGTSQTAICGSRSSWGLQRAALPGPGGYPCACSCCSWPCWPLACFIRSRAVRRVRQAEDLWLALSKSPPRR